MAKRNLLLLALMALASSMAAASVTSSTRKLMFLVQPQPNQLTYHNGAVLHGDIPISVLWYGSFTAAQARPAIGGIALVLTAQDVSVEGFCMSRCGRHGTVDAKSGTAYVWAGNPATQCAGQCAWPFHQPASGPQAPPLVAPNGDVGMDGLIINVASMVAGAVTNPFGDGFYQGEREAPLEAATACPGVYGKGAYPGNAGQLLVDGATGASYNAHGAHGRKYLLPALFDPATSACSTLV
ncbi:unnamed protein product [Triticum turgidum subsp. durum]|uniref:Uncharacterized protein n=1 Tax=Triticum turgidum subsp. durum TaxID=4567 RepID=A0A9R0Z832_TRITD|nr:unnamed protein product [Triticum turgidum subsp. durum]